MAKNAGTLEHMLKFRDRMQGTAYDDCLREMSKVVQQNQNENSTEDMNLKKSIIVINIIKKVVVSDDETFLIIGKIEIHHDHQA